jgi:predicted nucleic acid-binding protein
VYRDILRDLPNVTFVPVDDGLADEAADIAADYALRGMDTIYVAVARRHGCAPLTLDTELRGRTSALLPVLTPAEALAQRWAPGAP